MRRFILFLVVAFFGALDSLGYSQDVATSDEVQALEQRIAELEGALAGLQVLPPVEDEPKPLGMNGAWARTASKPCRTTATSPCTSAVVCSSMRSPSGALILYSAAWELMTQSIFAALGCASMARCTKRCPGRRSLIS